MKSEKELDRDDKIWYNLVVTECNCVLFSMCWDVYFPGTPGSRFIAGSSVNELYHPHSDSNHILGDYYWHIERLY